MPETWGAEDIPLNSSFEVELVEGYGTISAVCLPGSDGHLFWVDLDSAGENPTAEVYPVTMTKRLRPIERKSPFDDNAVLTGVRLKRPS